MNQETTTNTRHEPEKAPALVRAEAFGNRYARTVFFLTLAALVVHMTVVVGVDPAHAQQGGGGRDAIQGAIDNASEWLSGIMTSLGGLGLIASIGVKAIARTNENMHHAAHMGMAGSGIAIVAGLLMTDIIDLFAGFAK